MSSSTQIELAAMRKIAAALEALDRAARERVVGWTYDRFAEHPTDEAEQQEATRAEVSHA